ncbi:MAG: HD domain-containing protein [Candidatus Cloacimonetes bacterium]|nr:HD domain-containing protein [Candidatus Cloacimonadota bacterium]
MTETMKALPGFKVMKLNPFTLTFKEKDVENEYIIDYHRKSINQVRISFFMALALYAFYAILDIHIMPELKNIIWLIRFGGILPIGLLVIVSSYDKHFDNYRELTLSFALLLYGIGILIMIMLPPQPIDFVYYASLIVTFIFIYIFTGFRFIYASVCSITLLLIYQYVSHFIMNSPAEIISNNNIFFISTNIIGMFGSFSLEFYSRRDFYITKIIDNQRIILDDMNKTLEIRVIEQTKKLEIANLKLEDLLADSIAGLSSVVELRDPYTVGHQKRVGELAKAIAEEMKLDEDRIKGLVFAAESHDFGKILIPLEILAKRDKLNMYEKKLIERHSKAGYDILSKIDFPWPIADFVLQHHEKLDGSGYPNGLKGDEILLETKILTVADVMEAITSRRPYRVAMGVEKGLEELINNKNILYDGKVVDVCLYLFRQANYRFDYGV